jgi:DNA-binding response OmpR family regulator
LTRLEFGVLEFLQRRVGEAVPRSSLLACVWEQNYDGGGNVVDVVIRGLRKKLGEKASLIQTVHGVGYRLRRENTSTKSLTVHGSDHPIVTATAERFDPA